MKIIKSFYELKKEDFNFNLIVIFAKYNSGKSSICTDTIYNILGDDIIYATFINQDKPWFKARKSQIKFNQSLKNKTIIFDEISDDKRRNIVDLNILIQNNKVIILSNYLGNKDNFESEIKLFEKNFLFSKKDLNYIFLKTI